MESVKCLSCGSSAFRSDRPYGNFCSLWCWTKGIPTEAEEKETERQIKFIMEQWAVTNPSQGETAKSKD